MLVSLLEDSRLLAWEEWDTNDPRCGGRRGSMRPSGTGLADLGGVWNLAEVTGALSDLADFAVDQALTTARDALAEAGARFDGHFTNIATTAPAHATLSFLYPS